MWAESPGASNQGANKEEDERGEGNLCVSTYNNQALIECGGGWGGVLGGVRGGEVQPGSQLRRVWGDRSPQIEIHVL